MLYKYNNVITLTSCTGVNMTSCLRWGADEMEDEGVLVKAVRPDDRLSGDDVLPTNCRSGRAYMSSSHIIHLFKAAGRRQQHSRQHCANIQSQSLLTSLEGHLFTYQAIVTSYGLQYVYYLKLNLQNSSLNRSYYITL